MRMMIIEDDNDPKPDDEVANIGDRVPVPELGGSSLTGDRTETTNISFQRIKIMIGGVLTGKVMMIN